MDPPTIKRRVFHGRQDGFHLPPTNSYPDRRFAAQSDNAGAIREEM